MVRGTSLTLVANFAKTQLPKVQMIHKLVNQSDYIIISNDIIYCRREQRSLPAIEALLMFHITKIEKTQASKALRKKSYPQRGVEYLDSLTAWEIITHTSAKIGLQVNRPA